MCTRGLRGDASGSKIVELLRAMAQPRSDFGAKGRASWWRSRKQLGQAPRGRKGGGSPPGTVRLAVVGFGNRGPDNRAGFSGNEPLLVLGSALISIDRGASDGGWGAATRIRARAHLRRRDPPGNLAVAGQRAAVGNCSRFAILIADAGRGIRPSNHYRRPPCGDPFAAGFKLPGATRNRDRPARPGAAGGVVPDPRLRQPVRTGASSGPMLRL